MIPIVGEPLGSGPVTVSASDGAVRQDLMSNLAGSGTQASIDVSNAAPAVDQGIAGLVRPNIAPRAKGLDQ